MRLSETELKVLRYLASTHAANPRAEVPLVELERELCLEPGHGRRIVQDLVASGLAQADLFPVNVWVQITDEGLAQLERLTTNNRRVEP